MASLTVKHTDKRGLLYDLQHVLDRRGHAKYSVSVDDLARSTSAGKQPGLILLHFTKVFGTVNHSELLLKLHQYGTRESAPHLTRAFLGKRSVVLDDEESGSVPVILVVPQMRFWVRSCFSLYCCLGATSEVRLCADNTWR